MTEHSFNTKIAKEYGIECAIVIKNLDFWLSKNRANNKNYHDGKYWTYMSMTGFSEYFEYLTGNQVRYILKKLEENGVIETGNYNKKGYDRTKWYAFTDSFVKSYNSILQYSHIHLVKFPDAFEKIPEPIPYTNTDTIKDTNTDKRAKRTPTLEEVKEYFKQKGTTIDPVAFFNYYESADWYRGNTPIKKWKLCLNTWEQRERNKPKKKTALDYLAEVDAEESMKAGNEELT